MSCRAMISVSATALAGVRLAGFQTHRVAKRQCRRDLPGRRRDGEVPGADDCHHAHRFAPHVDLDAGAHAFGQIAVQAQSLGREIGEELAGAIDLALALGQRLALFAREDARRSLRPAPSVSVPIAISTSCRF